MKFNSAVQLLTICTSYFLFLFPDLRSCIELGESNHKASDTENYSNIQIQSTRVNEVESVDYNDGTFEGNAELGDHNVAIAEHGQESFSDEVLKVKSQNKENVDKKTLGQDVEVRSEGEQSLSTTSKSASQKQSEMVDKIPEKQIKRQVQQTNQGSEQVSEDSSGLAKVQSSPDTIPVDGGESGIKLDPNENDHLKQISGSDLLALKVDSNLRTGLSDWLAKYNISLPSTFLSRIDQLDLCPEHSLNGLPHYCTQMEDGQYYDPWNPWCGYIECLGEVATRKVCAAGTWMGFRGIDLIMPRGPAGTSPGGSSNPRSTHVDSKNPSERTRQQQPMLMTKDDMCRKKLFEKIQSGVCSGQTDYHLCHMAKQM